MRPSIWIDLNTLHVFLCKVTKSFTLHVCHAIAHAAILICLNCTNALKFVYILSDKFKMIINADIRFIVILDTNKCV